MTDHLLLTFVRDGASKDLVVPVVEGTGADLYRVAADRFGEQRVSTLTVERSGAEVRPDSPLDKIGVFNGDRILVGWNGRSNKHRADNTRLVVVEGPQAGTLFDLSDGRTTVGRGSSSTGRIGFDDSTVSRAHAEVVVDGPTVALRDVGSRNRTEINGEEVIGDAILQTGDLVRFGDTVVRVELGSRTGNHLAHGLGRITFNREPRVVTADPATTVELPVPPARPPRRKFPLPAAVVPVILGVAIYVAMGNPIFLLMAGMGPLMVVWTSIDDRRSGRRDFAESAARFHREVSAARSTLESTRRDRGEWLTDLHPVTSELVTRARAHSRLLWRRRVRDVDFGAVRLGTAVLRSPTTVRLPTTGDDDLLAVLTEMRDDFSDESDVPLVVSLPQRHVVGVVQRDEGLSDLVRACVAQLVADQSPKDLALAVLAPQHSADWEFAKWLPHVRAFGDDFRMIAHGDGEAKALFDSLVALVNQRSSAAEELIGGGSSLFTPHLVVVVHPPAKLSRREVTDFLERAAHVGVSVLWIATDRTSLPGECTAVIEAARGELSLTHTDTGWTVTTSESESLDVESMDQVARALAPLEDVSSGSDSVMPKHVDLLDLMCMPQISAADVVATWRDEVAGLRAVVGADGDGAVEIDWRTDGPHALVAGTTGSGKSELLRSLVASMAVLHPPTRLNFVLIDYKGGVAFKDCAALPHTVGMVTDLDGHLATRALVSLGAELHRRERLLNTVGANDIVEMVAMSPTTAPPNLLIIIDEFFALKKEVPAFVDGVIDIAQRGRSLGVHLLLATQQPSGVIDPKIQGNTNLRIAFRVADSSDSVDVIGRADAHGISKSVPGRGYVRTGPTDINEFQSAYVGGSGAGESEFGATTFHFGLQDRADLPRALEERAVATTDLQRLVAAVIEAFERESLPAPRPPWADPLSGDLRYSSLVGTAVPSGFGAIVGVADHPAEQMQRPYSIDFNEHANVVIYGSSGAGKTTFLRTIAMDLVLRNNADELWIYALDYSSHGLSALEELPHCGGVVFSDDLNRTRRLLEVLKHEVDERRRLFSASNASGPNEYAAITCRAIPRIVVFVDGFGQLWQTLDGIDRSEHLATLTSLVADGRSVGLHFVITADRRQAVPPTVASHISGRFMMRMAERDEYQAFGLRSLATAAPPVDGRAFTDVGLELQVAVLHYDGATTAVAQSRAISQLCAHLSDPTGPVPMVELLPELVSIEALGRPHAGRVPIGLDETSLSPTFVDLDDNPLFGVFGPDRSGRSTALTTLSLGLRDHVDGRYLIAGRRSPLSELGIWTAGGTAVGQENGQLLAERLQEVARQRADSGFDRPVLLVLDDGDAFSEGRVAAALEQIVLRARDVGFIVLVSMTTFAGHKSYATWIRAVRNNRHGLILQPDLEDDGDLFGIRLPHRSGLLCPAGRGYLVAHGVIRLVQVPGCLP